MATVKIIRNHADSNSPGKHMEVENNGSICCKTEFIVTRILLTNELKFVLCDMSDLTESKNHMRSLLS